MTERNPVGVLDLGDLQRRWSECQRARVYAVSTARSAGAQVLCPRNVDEPQVGGHRVYAAAERYLTIADENHDAFVSLLEHHGASPTAPWNLLRPTFEASFYARWLLRPDDSIVRRRRGIQLEWLDDEAARRFGNLVRSNPKVLEELGLPDASVQQRVDRANTKVYAGEASKVGLTFRTHDKKGRRVTPEPPGVNVANELARLEDDPMVTLGLQTTWSTLSGIQHSQGSSMVRVSDTTPVGEYPGGQQLHMTIKDGAFYMAAMSTTLLRTLAWVRFGECHRPMRSSAPVDLTPLREIAARATLDRQ